LLDVTKYAGGFFIRCAAFEGSAEIIHVILLMLSPVFICVQAFEKPLRQERDAAAARHSLAMKRLQAEKHLYVKDVSGFILWHVLSTVGVAACRQRPRVPQGPFKKMQAGRRPVWKCR
jgi:hypothetical protein